MLTDIDYLFALNSPHRENARVQENCNVHEEISILYVVKIILDVFVNKVIAVPTELPEPGNSRFYLETLGMAFGVGLDDEWHLGTRSNQRHVAQEHVQ